MGKPFSMRPYKIGSGPQCVDPCPLALKTLQSRSGNTPGPRSVFFYHPVSTVSLLAEPSHASSALGNLQLNLSSVLNLGGCLWEEKPWHRYLRLFQAIKECSRKSVKHQKLIKNQAIILSCQYELHFRIT